MAINLNFYREKMRIKDSQATLLFDMLSEESQKKLSRQVKNGNIENGIEILAKSSDGSCPFMWSNNCKGSLNAKRDMEFCSNENYIHCISAIIYMKYYGADK